MLALNTCCKSRKIKASDLNSIFNTDMVGRGTRISRAYKVDPIIQLSSVNPK